jgi:hypothetical protein
MYINKEILRLRQTIEGLDKEICGIKKNIREAISKI